MSRYDLDELDACWLELVNMELKEMGEYCLFTFFFSFWPGYTIADLQYVELKTLKKKCQKCWS